MQSFYQYMLTFRGKKHPDDKCLLADWIFQDQAFPKHATDYHALSDYLEWNSPFHQALATFDDCWQHYTEEKDK